MAGHDPRVDAYIAKSAEFAKPILVAVRTRIHAACPGVEETIKWRFPHFLYKGILCGVAAFKNHCSFGFWHPGMRAELKDQADDTSLGQFGRITSLDQLPSEAAFGRLVKKAMMLNESGTKPVRKRQGANALAVPPDFLTALRKNKTALASFEAFSPSHRNEYIEWITEARRGETRKRRIATGIAQIAAGKSHNWKYER